ncbi:MAG: OB-fold domain-containing protein [Desulfuromonadales bacterium]|nr:OB-fold domain-containing protein [Desulfuromonadales bacterium]
MDTTVTSTSQSAIELYYKGLEEGKLKARRCKDCGEHTFPPTGCCAHCGGWSLDWVDLSGKGTLLFATHNISPACHPRFEPIAPYVYGHICLDEGIIVQAIVQGVKATPEDLNQLFQRGQTPVEADILRMDDLPVLAFRIIR